MSDEPKQPDDSRPEHSSPREGEAEHPSSEDRERPAEATPPTGDADRPEPSDAKPEEGAPAAEEAPSGEEGPPGQQRGDAAATESAEEEETRDMAPEAPAEAGPAAGEEAAGPPPEGQPQAAPAEERPAPLPPQYDGLDSGLAWFGEAPFVPPAPTGYAQAGAAGEAVAPVPAAEGVGVRKQRVRERIEARRKEAEAGRKWYQRIPIPVLLSLPATIFIIVWILVVAQPWRRIPDPSEKLAESLLTAEPVENQSEGLLALRVATSSPEGCWQLLPGDVLRMDAVQRAASVTLQPPEKPSGFELTCDACIVEETGQEYTVTLLLDDVQGISLQGNQYSKRARGGQERQRTGTLRAVRIDATTRAQWSEERPLKLGYWYRMRIVVGPDSSRFYLNGRRMTQGGPQRPNEQLKPSLHVADARVLLRNLALKPIE